MRTQIVKIPVRSNDLKFHDDSSGYSEFSERSSIPFLSDQDHNKKDGGDGLLCVLWIGPALVIFHVITICEICFRFFHDQPNPQYNYTDISCVVVEIFSLVTFVFMTIFGLVTLFHNKKQNQHFEGIQKMRLFFFGIFILVITVSNFALVVMSHNIYRMMQVFLDLFGFLAMLLLWMSLGFTYENVKNDPLDSPKRRHQQQRILKFAAMGRWLHNILLCEEATHIAYELSMMHASADHTLWVEVLHHLFYQMLLFEIVHVSSFIIPDPRSGLLKFYQIGLPFCGFRFKWIRDQWLVILMMALFYLSEVATLCFKGVWAFMNKQEFAAYGSDLFSWHLSIFQCALNCLLVYWAFTYWLQCDNHYHILPGGVALPYYCLILLDFYIAINYGGEQADKAILQIVLDLSGYASIAMFWQIFHYLGKHEKHKNKKNANRQEISMQRVRLLPHYNNRWHDDVRLSLNSCRPSCRPTRSSHSSTDTNALIGTTTTTTITTTVTTTVTTTATTATPSTTFSTTTTTITATSTTIATTTTKTGCNAITVSKYLLIVSHLILAVLLIALFVVSETNGIDHQDWQSYLRALAEVLCLVEFLQITTSVVSQSSH